MKNKYRIEYYVVMNEIQYNRFGGIEYLNHRIMVEKFSSFESAMEYIELFSKKWIDFKNLEIGKKYIQAVLSVELLENDLLFNQMEMELYCKVE